MAHVFWNKVHNDSPRSSKVIDFGTNRKRVYNFLLDLNSNLGTILPRFTAVRAFVRQKPLFSIPLPYSGQNFGVFPWNRSVMLGAAETEHHKREIILEDFQPMWSGYLNVTDRQTDDLP